MRLPVSALQLEGWRAVAQPAGARDLWLPYHRHTVWDDGVMSRSAAGARRRRAPGRDCRGTGDPPSGSICVTISVGGRVLDVPSLLDAATGATEYMRALLAVMIGRSSTPRR